MLSIWPVITVGMRGTAAEKIKRMAREFRLDLIDWSQCNRHEPDEPGFVDCLTS
jgi:hypothetical protein